MPTYKSQLDLRSETYKQNRADMLAKLDQLESLYAEAAAGGGEAAMARLSSRNKMPVRERIAWALDRDAPFLELSPLAAWRSNFEIGRAHV